VNAAPQRKVPRAGAWARAFGWTKDLDGRKVEDVDPQEQADQKQPAEVDYKLFDF